MRKKQTFPRPALVLTLLLGMLAVGLPAAADDDDDEFALSFEDKQAACAACHGEKGDKPLAPDYPVLAGQYADYLANSLKSYGNGQRNHPIMVQQIEILELSDDDIERLAAYFAAQKGLTTISR
ncbi:MAG: c-type cytochrome [Pseudomonadota bacterium]